MADTNSAMSPISAAEPPKSPLLKPTVTGAKTIKLNPVIRKPTVGGSADVKPIIRKPIGGAAGLAKPLPKPVVPAAAPAAGSSEPMAQLKSVTQKLKGMTQEIPQQAILHKTGIIDDGAVSDIQKQAAKSKTSRISLNDAIGAATVKNESAPMKTIRIKRPVDLPNSAPVAEGDSAVDVTQRKTLKVARPGSAVRPTGKFGIKRPVATPNTNAAAPATENSVAEIADIPEIPAVTPNVKATANVSGLGLVLSMVVQVAACLVMGALVWFLFQNTQVAYF